MREESSELVLERERAFSVLKQIDVAYLDGAWHKTKKNQWTIDSIKIGKKDIVFAHELQTILHDETKTPGTKKTETAVYYIMYISDEDCSDDCV